MFRMRSNTLSKDLINILDKSESISWNPLKKRDFLEFVEAQYRSPSNDKLVLLELVIENSPKIPKAQTILNHIHEILELRKNYSFSLCSSEEDRNIVSKNLQVAIQKSKKLAKKSGRTLDEEMWVSQIPYLEKQLASLNEYNQQLEMHSLSNKELKKLSQKFGEILSDSDSDSDIDNENIQITSMRSSIADEILKWRQHFRNDGSSDRLHELKEELKNLIAVVLPNQNLSDQEITKFKIKYLEKQLSKNQAYKNAISDSEIDRSHEKRSQPNREKLIKEHKAALEHLETILDMMQDPDPNARIGEGADPKTELLDLIKLIQSSKNMQEKNEYLEVFGMKVKEYLEDVRESKIISLKQQVEMHKKAIQKLEIENVQISKSKSVLYGYDRNNTNDQVKRGRDPEDPLESNIDKKTKKL